MEITITKDDICTPTSIPGEVPATELSLASIIEKEEDNFEAIFALGFMQLRASKFTEAIKSFSKACELNSESAEARHNLGISFLGLSQAQASIKELRKAVLLRKDFALGFYNLGRAFHLSKENKSAIQNYKKSLSIKKEQVKVLVLLADLVEGKEALKYLEQVYALDSEQAKVRDMLAMRSVDEAFVLFEKETNNFEAAFSLLSLAYKKYPLSFSANQSIVEKIRKKAREFQSLGAKDKAVKKYWQSFLSESDKQKDFLYTMLNTCLFTFGLIPEVWVAFDEIDSKTEHWKPAATSKEIVPYAKYRYGLLLFFQAEFENARKELEAARDSLPKSKHEGIKIEEIIELVKNVISLHRSAGEQIDPDTSAEDEWEKNGFKDAFQIKAWRAVGIKPEYAAKWKDVSFSPQQASDWVKNKIDAAQAKQWKDAGIDDPKEARRWLVAGVKLVQATEWRKFFNDTQMPIQCIQAGFNDPETADRWMKLFTFPSEAMRWIELNFKPQEAAIWLRQGVSDPFEAKRQNESSNEDILE